MSPPSLPGSRPTIPAHIAGRYRVVRFLGAGAMGAVYEVQDESGKRLAAKLFVNMGGGSEGDGAAARFMREASATAFVAHPNVVTVSDVGLDPELGTPFYLMDLLEGTDLGGLLDRLGALHPMTAARIVRQACRGLEAAHAKGIVHRDVKPSNLFLHQEGSGKIRVKVCDFGIAKWTLLGSALTQSGAMLGTPLYMAPEQATQPKYVDHRADVWSLGMTLFHALTGRAAHERVGSFLQLMVALDRGDTPPVQEFAPWIEPRLAAIVHGTLLRDREARCPSVAALGAALDALLGRADELDADELVPIPEAAKAVVAPRATLPRQWSDIDSHAAFDTTLGLPTRDSLPVRLARSQYRITRMIGRGGMAVVYQATAQDGTEVAVKFIHDAEVSKATEARRRFIREGKALQEISSPYVVRIFEAATAPEDGVPFLVMELLHGTDIAHLVRQWGALEPRVAVRIFIQICEGLSAAHDRGIVHRDVKPANLFLHELPDGTVVPKVCDFGIAKRPVADRTDPTLELTRTGGMIGSPVYMSPEQARNAKDVDEGTDIWGVGICLWEVLTGHKPWEDRSSLGELILAICTQPLTPIQQLAPWIEPGLADAIQRCLLAERAHRWRSMRDLAAALEPFAAPESRIPRIAVVPVPQAVRESVAQALQSGPSGLSVSRVTSAPPRSRGWVYAAAGAGVATLAILAGLASRSTVAPAPMAQPPVPDTASAPPVPAPPPRVTGVLRIPAHAVSARVDGAETAIADGGIALSGSPGTSFSVDISNGTDTVTARVVIDSAGQIVPPELDVSPAPAKRPPHTKAGESGGPKGTGASAATTSPPATTRSEPTAKPPSTIAPDDEWR